MLSQQLCTIVLTDRSYLEGWYCKIQGPFVGKTVIFCPFKNCLCVISAQFQSLAPFCKMGLFVMVMLVSQVTIVPEISCGFRASI